MIDTKIACDNCHRDMADGYSVSMGLIEDFLRITVKRGIDKDTVMHFCGKRCVIEHFSNLLDQIKERRTAA